METLEIFCDEVSLNSLTQHIKQPIYGIQHVKFSKQNSISTQISGTISTYISEWLSNKIDRQVVGTLRNFMEGV